MASLKESDVAHALQPGDLHGDWPEQYQVHDLTVISSSKIRSKVSQVLTLLSNDSTTPSGPSTRALEHHALGKGDVQRIKIRPKNTVVSLRAALPVSAKLVTVVEIVKRHVIQLSKDSAPNSAHLLPTKTCRSDDEVEPGVSPQVQIGPMQKTKLAVKPVPLLYQYTSIRTLSTQESVLTNKLTSKSQPIKSQKRKRASEEVAPALDLLKANGKTLNLGQEENELSTNERTEDTHAADLEFFEALDQTDQHSCAPKHNPLFLIIHLSKTSIRLLKDSYGEQIVM